MAKVKKREPLELRPIKIEQSLLPAHDGSALFSFGSVAALTAISGPSEVRIRDEKTDKAALHVHFTPLQGIAGTSAMALEHALLDVWSNVLQLHLYPRALIQIHLQSYACPPSYAPRPLMNTQERVPINPPPIQTPHPDAPIPAALKAAHINATTLACLDAAVNMRSMVAAASAVVARKHVRTNLMQGWRPGEVMPTDVDMNDDQGFEILLDPTPYEESLARSSHVFAFAFELRAPEGQDKDSWSDKDVANRLQAEMIFNESQGVQTGDDYLGCLSLCRQASQDIVMQMRKTMAARLATSEQSE